MVLKTVCGSFLHKRKTTLNHVFEFKNSNIDMSINSSSELHILSHIHIIYQILDVSYTFFSVIGILDS